MDNELKEFWEKCGFTDETGKTEGNNYFIPQYPKLTLGNLFRYAVNKIKDKYTYFEVSFEYGTHGNMTVIARLLYTNMLTREPMTIAKYEADNETQALYQAIKQVLMENFGILLGQVGH